MDAVAQCLVVFGSLGLELVAQTLVERLEISVLLLQLGLDSLSLFACVLV